MELVGLVRDTSMDFGPGTQCRYNNTGYVLLGLIVEKVSGRPWGTFLDERIFTPTGMPTARVNDLGVVVSHRAQGYAWANGEFRNGEYVSPTQPYAAGAMLVSVLDLIARDRALSKHAVLTPASEAAMYAPTLMADGKTHPYGFGWDVAPYRTRPRHAHGGGIPGFSTYYARFPDDGVSVIVLTNGGGGSELLANGIAEFYLPALREHAPKAIEDAAPERTAFLKRVLLALARGTGEQDWFTPEAQVFFFPDRIKEGTWRVGGYGALQTFELMERSTSEKGEVRGYRARFETMDVRCTFTMSNDGKVAGIGLRPE